MGEKVFVIEFRCRAYLQRVIMGNSDSIVIPFYKRHIGVVKEPVALLGFSNNNHFQGDMYDLSLNNWNINSEWSLDKKYGTIICTRCAYFAKNPKDFIRRCYDNLEDGGVLHVDWGLGDHWRFKNFKVGWVKDGEQEHAYKDENMLWSSIWNDEFLLNDDVKKFSEEIKSLGYDNLGKAVRLEVPFVLDPKNIDDLFNYDIKFLFVKKPYLQLYMMLRGDKR